MEYVIADYHKKRCKALRKRIDIYRSVQCIGMLANERELLEKVWIEQPDLVLIYVGDQMLNAYSALLRIKEVTPHVKVAFFSEKSEYAIDAYEKGADYFLLLPADDIQIGKLIFRYLKAG